MSETRLAFVQPTQTLLESVFDIELLNARNWMTSLTQIQHDVAIHEPWLRSIIRARINDRTAAEDIMSEVFGDALALGERWQEVQSHGPWLYRVTIRKIFQYRRKAGREKTFRQRFSRETVIQDRWTQRRTPLDFLITNERNEVVRQAMKTLPGKCQEVLILKYVHGWNYDQISQNLGVNKTKVANRLRQARGRLRQVLNEKLNDENENNIISPGSRR